jgi:hypothetical protein
VSFTLHLQQASMKFNQSRAQIEKDLEDQFTRGADFVGHTEAPPRGNVRPVLLEVAADFGYRVHRGPGDTCISVARDWKVTDSGSELVVERKRAPLRLGGHGPRFIDFVTAERDGEIVSVHEAHWLAGYTRSAERKAKHLAMTQAMIHNVRAHAPGRALSFFMGDININERLDRGQDPKRPHAQFTKAGLQTIWDELQTYTPGTHGPGNPIDVIGKTVRDVRVTGRKVKVWPKGHSDHRAMSALYEVR